jgi:hypothetical protein
VNFFAFSRIFLLKYAMFGFFSFSLKMSPVCLLQKNTSTGLTNGLKDLDDGPEEPNMVHRQLQVDDVPERES